MKRYRTTLMSLLLTVMMIVTFIPQTAFAEGEGVQPPEKIEQPYMEVDFGSLADQNALALSDGMDGTTVSKEQHDYGALIKGPVSELESGRVEIVSEFDFTENPVGRLSLHGVAEAGTLVDALVYLDDETVPVCEFPLDNRNKTGGWNIGAMQTENVYPEGITGTHKVSIGFRVTGKDGDQKVNVLLRKIELSEDPGIPTLYFNINEDVTTIEEMNSSDDHSVECYGSVDIKVPDGYQSEYESSPMRDKSCELEYIRGRGNSTWTEDKKPYKVRLKSKENLFGMGSNAHWVLLANRFDNSFMRNRMTYWLGAEMGLEFTPQCVPVEVVMNGEYYGSYLLCEQVRIGSKRVNIDELEEGDTTLPDISGGYLLSMNPYSEDPNSYFKTERGADFFNEEPDFVKYDSQAQKDYIRGYMQDTEDAIFGSGFKNAAGESWQEYMDIDSATGYWWVQEFSMNGDAYVTGSTYLYKKRNGKLFWGPLWDFDVAAWGDMDSRETPHVEGFGNTRMVWFDHLLADPDFVDALESRWTQMDGLLTDIVKEGGLLDQYYEQTKISQRYDHEKYGYDGDEEFEPDSEYAGSAYQGGETGGEGLDPNRPYIDEVDRLREWIAARRDWVTENFDSLKSLTSTVTFVIDGNVAGTLIAKGWITAGEIPEVPDKDGYVFSGWYTKPEGGDKLEYEEEIVTDNTKVIVNEDTTYYARYVKEETASKAEYLFIGDRNDWEDITRGTYTPFFVTLPKDAEDSRISWTSSNEEKATVNKKGEVTMLNTGKVTITGTLRSGASASYVLNIYDPETTTVKAAKAIRMESDEVMIEMGSYGYNPFTLEPEGEPIESFMAYESEDESIVIAGICGELYPVSPGTTTVTVRDWINDIETSFEVTVTGEEDPDGDLLDAIDNAIAMLVKMNSLVRKADYTKASYDAYYSAYSSALDRLKRGSVTLDEISELRHEVIIAQLDLVKKSANTMKVKAKTVKVKRSKVKRKAQTIKKSKAFTIRNAKGKLTFAKVAKGSSKRLSISKKTGKIKVKKGTKKGLYRIKVKVTAAGTGEYRPMSKVVTVKVRVK